MQLMPRKVAATAALAIWLAVVALVWGPVRWEFAHTYQHWIEDWESHLPVLTTAVSLPVLGLGSSTVASFLVRTLFWGLAWLGPAILLLGVWRARTPESLTELLLLGWPLYAASLLLLLVLVILGLWIPFGLL